MTAFQVATGGAVFQLKLVQFDNPAGQEDNGNCCESPSSWTCYSFFASNCDPSLKICVGYPHSSECTEGTPQYDTGVYGNTNHITFGSTFNNGNNNPMEFRIIHWTSAVKITIEVDDIDSYLGGDHDSMGKTSVIFDGNLVTRRSDDTWYDITFDYNYQTITAQARAYCMDHYYGALCTDYCNPNAYGANHYYTCDGDRGMICRENYYGESCLVHCQPQDSYAGHFTCSGDGTPICNDGWTGEMCTEDIDECRDKTDNPCLPNGSCTNKDGSYSCVCDDAHTGRYCQDVRLYCDDNPCSNHISLCNDILGGYQCVCDFGWTGDICDEQVTPCSSSPCRHNAKCAVVSDSYECNCTDQWQGATCEIAKPEPCAERSCLNNGTRINVVNNTLSIHDSRVTRHWSIIQIVVIVIVLTIAAIIVVWYISRRRRLAIMKKSGFDNHISVNGVTESVPDATTGFDNSLYFEVLAIKQSDLFKYFEEEKKRQIFA